MTHEERQAGTKELKAKIQTLKDKCEAEEIECPTREQVLEVMKACHIPRLITITRGFLILLLLVGALDESPRVPMLSKPAHELFDQRGQI